MTKSWQRSMPKVVELLVRAVEMRSTISAATGAMMREGKLAPKYNPSGSDGNEDAKVITRAKDERDRWCRELHQKPGELVACVYQECLARAAKAARDQLAGIKARAVESAQMPPHPDTEDLP